MQIVFKIKMKYFKQLGLLLFAADSMLRAQIIIICVLFFLFQKDISAQNRFNKAIDYRGSWEFGWTIFNNDSFFVTYSGVGDSNRIDQGVSLDFFDTNGNIISRKDLITPNLNLYPGFPSCIKIDRFGNYVNGGSVDDLFTEYDDAYLLKLNGNGDTIFLKYYDVDSITIIYNTEISLSNQYYLVGSTQKNVNAIADYAVIKTDSLGNMIWAKRYGFGLREIAHSIIEYTSERFFTFGGRVYSGNLAAPWVVDIDSAGNVVREKWFMQGALRCGSFLANKSFTDNIIIYGCLDTVINVNGDGATRYIGIFDTSMNVQIVHIYDNTRFTYPYIVKQLPTDSSFVTVGFRVNAPGSSQALGYISKVSETGQLLWEREYYYKNEVFNYFSDFQPTADGGFIITGATNGDTSQDIWLVKLDSLGLLNDSLIVNTGTVLANSSTNILQLYPNPAKEQLHLKIFFTQKQNTTATLMVYDMLGKQIISENINLQQGKANHSINVSNLPGGNYITIVQIGGEVVKQRFVRE